MIQYREITAKEAIDLIFVGEIKSVYFELPDGSIDCVKNYRTSFEELPKEKYFKKEIS